MTQTPVCRLFTAPYYVGGVTGSQVDSFLTQRRQQADTCDGQGQAESPFIISAAEAAQTQARRVILRRRWKYLWTCRSSASAPTGPAGCSCTSDTRRSEGSGTPTATGTPAQTARGDRARPRTPLARGRPPGSRRPARWRGSPGERRH